MLRIDALHFEDVRDLLRAAGREMPFVEAYTLTQMGQAAKARLQEKLPQDFDRPTPWIKNSIWLKMATKADLQAVVWVKYDSINALAHHIEGGKRPAKGFEKRLRTAGILKGSNQFVVPAKRMKLDQYGNVSRGLINKVLSALGAQGDRYANTTAKALQRNPGQGKYFISPRQGKLRTGIFEVIGRGGNRQLQPVFLFVKSTTYKHRWPFVERAEDAAYDAMPAAAAKALARIGL